MTQRDDKAQKESQRLVKSMMMGMGLLLVIGGAIGVFSPAHFSFITGDDYNSAKLIGGAFIFAGIMDIILAKVLFTGADTL